MLSLITAQKAQQNLAESTRARRLNMELTQEGLAKRADVPLPTLRRFEQKGAISLEAFLKIQLVLGGLGDIVQAAQPKTPPFASIDDVVKSNQPPTRKRGWRN